MNTRASKNRLAAQTTLAGRLPDGHIRFSKHNSNEKKMKNMSMNVSDNQLKNLERKDEADRSHIYTLN